ncbi:MAG: 2-oxo-tetronate isomerase [Burkholderiales bacterium]
MPKFAANLSFLFTEFAFLTRFAAAAQARFNAVEFLFPYEFSAQEIAARLKQHQLQNVLFNLPPGNWHAGERGIAILPGREAEFRQSVATAIDYAKAFECPRLHALAGIAPAGCDRLALNKIYVGNLRFAAEQLAKHDLTLLIEPINTFDMPGYFLNTQAEAFSICQQVGAPNIKMQMDIYHMQMMGEDLEVNIRRFLPHVGHIQIASVPGRHEPDAGEIDYPNLFRLLDELEYRGWIGCEYKPKTTTLEGLRWLEQYR